MTYESAFPNITNEELHISISKYNNVYGNNVLDDITNCQINNTLISNNMTSNTSIY